VTSVQLARPVLDDEAWLDDDDASVDAELLALFDVDCDPLTLLADCVVALPEVLLLLAVVPPDPPPSLPESPHPYTSASDDKLQNPIQANRFIRPPRIR
jgi:hypothetical protein